MDAERTRVLWVGHGNSRAAIRPFFEQLGERCQQIEAVAMDMNTAFDLEVKQHCPQAEVVYDLFHVVARYGREVVDRVRVEQANALKAINRRERVVKSARWLLLRNRAKLSEKQDVKLQELLAANQPLAMVYVLKEALKGIWYAPSDVGRMATMAELMRQVKGKRASAAATIWSKFIEIYAGDPGECKSPILHTSVLEGEQIRSK